MRHRESSSAWVRGAVLLVFFGMCRPAPAIVTFDWATIGNAGNPADTLVMTKTGSIADMTTGYGAVGYTYRIAKHHVTNAQYTEFLNAVDATGTNARDLYDDRMEQWYHPTSFLPFEAYSGGIGYNATAATGSKYSVIAGKENYPATWINWESGARFVNWLHNGQLADGASTDNGVYDISQISSSLTRPVTLPQRQAGAQYFLPSENEFYKAAYYDPTKNSVGGYWQYGVRSDSPPVSEGPSTGARSANYTTAAGAPGVNGDLYWQSGGGLLDISLNHLTDVGAYVNATSYYGLYDIDGLIYQWTEGTKTINIGGEPTPFPVYRGGSWSHSVESNGAAFRHLYSWAAADSYAHFGLRIAAAEPVLPGDFNADGLVDAADYPIWRDNLGNSDEAILNGGGDGANGVDAADYTLWVNNFDAISLGVGSLSAPASSTVPEPSCAALLATLSMLAAASASFKVLQMRST